GRDRAAPLHGAQQPVLEPRSERSDGQPAGHHLPVCAQPLSGVAAARLDRRPDHYRCCSRAECRGAIFLKSGTIKMNEAVISAAKPAPTKVAGPDAKVLVRNLRFYYGDTLALKTINVGLGDRKVTAFIGPSGCGKSTLLRVLNRIYDLYPHQRAEGE